ncbi:trehalase [Loa loa]|uniref:Trehalase n=2 Tax=Loa loa TaxID=7209 RepID=A0A1S0TNQ0_LOALO|nr:trehalase [Loa loa]EFO17509.1 trehalase [Loa loa]
MHPLLFSIFYIFMMQLFTADSECNEKLFHNRYCVIKRFKRRPNNITKNDTITTETDTLLDQLEMMTIISNNETIRIKQKQAIFNQDDILSSEFEPPEFACNRNHSKAAEIYCYGDILHVVMMLGLYKDSKTFVDKPLKKDPDEVTADFQRRFSKAVTEEDREQVEQFIEDNFGVEGEELDQCELSDWQEEPERLLTIENSALRQFALQINYIWKHLCRTVKKEVKEQPQRHSLIYVPNEFIVPGGRFREYYYWDGYWIIKGLLASGMQNTTRRMIENFAHLINTFGFIPNGGRIYYLRRSQPPLFIPMVYEYYAATKDDDFLASVIEAMEKELFFWKTRRSITIEKNGRNYTVFRYRAESNIPRPESYREDYVTTQHVLPSKKRALWRDIASGAESGWDFSSRWFADRKTLETCETSNIAPVDLNAFMCWNMGILAHIHGHLGNLTRRNELNKERNIFIDTFTDVFYDKREKAWFDVNIRTGKRNYETYPSIAIPLFAECYRRLDTRMMNDVLNTLQRSGILNFPFGVPVSLIEGTNQQWDFPNGWANVNHMIIEGLRRSNYYRMQQKAFDIARKWIDLNYKAYLKDGKMWEKYDVTKPYEKKAGGGEYEIQNGFGWTNGVALDLLVTYGKLLSFKDEMKDVRSTSRTTTISPDFILLLTLTLLLMVNDNAIWLGMTALS